MRAIKLSILIFLGTTLLVPPALAGGWWSYLQVPGRYVGIGETIEFTENEVLFATIEEAGRAKSDGFGVFLVQSYDKRLLEDAMTRPEPDHWWEPLSTPVRIGNVDLIDPDSNLMKARVTFTVPEVAPGRYAIVLCSAPNCEEPLGNVVPAEVMVTEDVLLAKTARRVANQRFENQMSFVRVRHRLKGVREQVSDLRAKIGEPDPAPAAAPDSPTLTPEATTPWVAYAGWFFAGVSTAFLLLRRRTVNVRPNQVLQEHIPDDARELMKVP